MTQATTGMSNFKTYTRGGGKELEKPFEKVVVVPTIENKDAAAHAWADARFAVDIMAEHAIFFSLLMPPETCEAERKEAIRFSETFTNLYQEIDSAQPTAGELKRFASNFTETVKPFIDYKARLGETQASGKLHSLVWPLFFDHTRHEAERWTRRLETLAGGESEFDKDEVSTFWTNIMDEHCRFVAHLLDPDESELIETAMNTSRVFRDLHEYGGIGGAVVAVAHEPSTVVGSLIQNPETSAILSAAETILDFKTKAVRDIEAARIKSIIDPRLADHVRREALKFVDELKRAV
ncbi:MAG TPA: DUF2935 domain-containing protein [Aridibacter sp.]|nr:DUF2935 domain-containing protein [Aridibacter sp.]